MARDEGSQGSQLPIASIPQSVALGQPLQSTSLPVTAPAPPPAGFQSLQIPDSILKEEVCAESKAGGGESEGGALPGAGVGAGAGFPLIQVLQPVVQSAHQSPAVLVQSMPVLPPNVAEGGTSGLGFDVAAVEGSTPLTTMPSGVPTPITSPALQLQVPHLTAGSQQAILASAVENIVLPNVSAKSIVWKYFGFPPLQGTLDVPDKTFTRCRLCRGKIPYKGQTTNMLKHLESKHRVDYESLKSKIGQQVCFGGKKTNNLCRKTGVFSLVQQHIFSRAMSTGAENDTTLDSDYYLDRAYIQQLNQAMTKFLPEERDTLILVNKEVTTSLQALILACKWIMFHAIYIILRNVQSRTY